MTAGAICGPAPAAYVTLAEEPEPERWCYGERKRRTGRHILRGLTAEYVLETGAAGWGEPFWTYRCDGCGKDRRWMW